MITMKKIIRLISLRPYKIRKNDINNLINWLQHDLKDNIGYEYFNVHSAYRINYSTYRMYEKSTNTDYINMIIYDFTM